MGVEVQAKVESEIGLSAMRAAVGAMFFINGVAGGNWVTRIPAVQQQIGLDAAQLGIGLLGGVAGSLLLMPATGRLVAMFGSKAVTTVTAVAFCLSIVLPALAFNLPTLFLALMVVGATTGSMDVAMNSNGVAVEGHYGRPIMSSLHALFSVGGLVGAFMGGLVAGAGVAPLPHLLAVGIVLALAGWLTGRWLLTGDRTSESGPAFALPDRAILALGLIGFCCLVGEGAMADWSAVYLRQSLGTSEGLAAAGYGAFSLTMAAVRFGGDWLQTRLGSMQLVRGGGLLAAVGLGLSLLVAHPVAALIGFGCVGAGLATIFPTVLSAAGRSSTRPSHALAAVATCGYLGFLAGPPLIGFVSRGFGLGVGLGVVVLSSAVIGLLAGAVAGKQRG